MNSAAADHTIVLFIIAVLLFNSPLTGWWAAFALPWYALFLPWALVIVLVAINQRRRP